MKKIKEDTNNENTSCIHGLEDIILLKCSYYPKQSTCSMTFLSKSQCLFCRNRKKAILKFRWNHKRPLSSQINLREKTEAGGITHPNFKIYCKAIVLKIMWYRHKDRHE